ncbi:MAG: fibronectin type III domain-containing protein [Spirochaetia bacterium]|nr:fibronectin type III domain-containing protein [Spirochaetia bacterium]
MKRIFKNPSIFLSSIFVLGTWCFSCSQSTTEFNVQSDRGLEIQELALDKSSLILRGNKNQTQEVLTASYMPSFAQDTYIKWTSSDENVVTVSNTGSTTCTVTLQGNGSAVVTASNYSGKIKANCKVTGVLDKTPPEKISALTLTPYANNIAVNWTNGSSENNVLYGARAFIYEGTDSSGIPVLSVDLEGGEGSKSYSKRVKNLEPQTEYYAEVYALSLNGIVSVENLSAAVTTLQEDNENPLPVSGLQLSAEKEGELIVEWKDSSSSDLQYIAISYGSSDSTDENQIIVEAGKEKSVLENLDSSLKYTVKVFAVDNNFNNSDFVEKSIDLKSSARNLVLTPSTSYSGVVDFSWTNPEIEFDSIKVEAASSGSCAEKILENTESSVTFAELVPDELYTFTIKLLGKDGAVIGKISKECRAPKIIIKVYSRKTNGYLVPSSGKTLITQSGNSAAYSFKWIKRPALDGTSAITYDADGVTGKTETFSLEACDLTENPTGLYLCLSEKVTSSSSVAAPILIAEKTAVETYGTALATFFKAAVNTQYCGKSDCRALRVNCENLLIGATSSNSITARNASSLAGVDEYHWAITQEDKTTQD